MKAHKFFGIIAILAILCFIATPAMAATYIWGGSSLYGGSTVIGPGHSFQQSSYQGQTVLGINNKIVEIDSGLWSHSSQQAGRYGIASTNNHNGTQYSVDDNVITSTVYTSANLTTRGNASASVNVDGWQDIVIHNR